MASITLEQSYEAYMEHCVKPLRKFRDENPHLFTPFQIIVVKDDGTEVDLCDISRPLSELLAE